MGDFITWLFKMADRNDAAIANRREWFHSFNVLSFVLFMSGSRDPLPVGQSFPGLLGSDLVLECFWAFTRSSITVVYNFSSSHPPQQHPSEFSLFCYFILFLCRIFCFLSSFHRFLYFYFVCSFPHTARLKVQIIFLLWLTLRWERNNWCRKSPSVPASINGDISQVCRRLKLMSDLCYLNPFSSLSYPFRYCSVFSLRWT